MRAILDGEDAEAAGTAWLKTHPTVLEDWLAGVAARDGSDGLASVRAHLGL
jgi:glycine betaine/proline transport system substrate-binding protein